MPISQANAYRSRMAGVTSIGMPNFVGDRRRGLQRPGVRRDEDPLQRFAFESGGGLLGLRVSERSQLGVRNSGIAPRLTEVEVELALSVSQQDHAAGK